MLVPYQGKVKLGAKVFCVWIGESQADRNRRDFLAQYCELSGWYFHRWTGEAEDYLEWLSIIKPSTPYFDWTKFDIIYISAYDCCKHVACDSLLCVENPNRVIQAKRILKSIFDPSFLNPVFVTLKKIVPFSSIRKNLSLLCGGDPISVMVYFGLILLLFLFAGWLEGRYVYGL